MSFDILTSDEVRSRLGLKPTATLQHIAVSTKPWGNFKASDYTPEQWKAACLIVRGDGSSKMQCSLPVREPDGTLNKNALPAAAAALAGARGGVIASVTEKAAAKKKLIALYNQINATPPPSLTHNAMERVGQFVEHFGTKGMKWGVRKSDSSSGSNHGALKSEGKSFIRRAMGDKTYWKRAAIIAGIGVSGLAAAAFAPAVLPVGLVAAAGGTASLSTMMTVTSMAGMRAANVANYINYIHRSRSAAHDGIGDTQLQHAGPTVREAYDSMSPAQQDLAAILVAAAVKNVDVSGDTDLSQAWNGLTDNQKASIYFLAIVSDTLENGPNDTMAQASLRTEKFLEHFGIRGMKWGIRRPRGPEGTVSSLPGVKGVGTETQSTGGSHGGGGHSTSNTTHTPTDFEQAKAIKLKAQRQGLKSLSNTEVQLLVTRMNLERQFDQNTAKPSNIQRGREFVKEQMKTGKTINEMIAFANSPAGHLLASAIRSSGTGRHAGTASTTGKVGGGHKSGTGTRSGRQAWGN
jgi:hypothetical protein